MRPRHTLSTHPPLCSGAPAPRRLHCYTTPALLRLHCGTSAAAGRRTWKLGGWGAPAARLSSSWQLGTRSRVRPPCRSSQGTEAATQLRRCWHGSEPPPQTAHMLLPARFPAQPARPGMGARRPAAAPPIPAATARPARSCKPPLAADWTGMRHGFEASWTLGSQPGAPPATVAFIVSWRFLQQHITALSAPPHQPAASAAAPTPVRRSRMPRTVQPAL